MIQFQVPQFIETEDKIVGPLTLKQFGYIGSIAAVIALLILFLNFFAWLMTALVLGSIAVMLAFGKYNGRPISIFFRSLLKSIWSPSVYVFEPRIVGTKRPIPQMPKIPTRHWSFKSLFKKRAKEAQPARKAPKLTREDFALGQEYMLAKPQAEPEPVKPSPTTTDLQPTLIENIQPAAPIAGSKPDFGGIKNLWQIINTSKTAVPRREKPLPTQTQSFDQFREQFEAVRHITGERELAKRVDYR